MSKDINLATGQSIQDGNGNYATLSLKEQVLPLLSQSVSTFMAARSPYSGDVVGNGNILYRTPHLISTNAYSQGQTSSINPTLEEKWVKVSDYRTAVYEIESFDASMIENSAQALGEVSRSLGTSIMADMNAHFFMTIKEYLDQHPEQTFCLPQLAEMGTLTRDAQVQLQKDILNVRNVLTKLKNKKYINVNSNDFIGLVDNIGSTNLQLISTGLNASDKAYDQILYGLGGQDTLDVNKLGNLTYITDNFINSSMVENQSFNGDYSFDLGGYLGFIVHREAVAFPMGLNEVKAVTNPNNANIRYIAKYCFGRDVIRPELICGLVDTYNATILDKQDAYKVGDKFIVRVNSIGEPLEFTGTNCTLKKIADNQVEATITAAGEVKVNFTLPANLEVKVQATA